jgi:organic radical activating enzyme
MIGREILYINNDNILELFLKYGCLRKEVKITITEKCNIRCEHCYMESGPECNSLISDEHIDKVFESLDSSWGMSIFGGEPTLYPEKVLRIANNCREKDMYFNIFTNGWWGTNEKMVKMMKEEIRPNLIIVSISEYHKGIDTKNYDQIFEIFKDDPDICVMFNTMIGHEGPYLQTLIDRGVKGMCDRLEESGRSKEEDPDYSFIKVCENRGFEVRPDGSIYSICNFKHGCPFGHIDTDRIADLRTKYLKLPWWKTVEPLQSVCKYNALLDDERWPPMPEDYFRQFAMELSMYKAQMGGPLDLDTFDY